MISSIALASMCMSLYAVLGAHPFENEATNSVCFPLLAIIYAILLCVATDSEHKLKKRIETLEKKLADKKEGGEGE